MHLLWRVFFSIAFVAITIVPPFGLVWLAISYAPQYPLLFTLVGAFWVIVAALIIPLTQKHFKATVAVANILQLVVVSSWLFMSGSFGQWPDWLKWLYAAVAIGLIIGIQIIATPIFRWFRGVMPVDNSAGHDTSHQ